MNQLTHSKLQNEKSFYLKYNSEGVTEVVNSSISNLEERSCYRQVHNLEKESKDHQGPKLFTDQQYEIDLGIEFSDDERIIVKRLGTLYGVSNRPPFFDLTSQPTKPENPSEMPHCINELAVFSTLHYKTLFITQKYSESGKYILITNSNGRFEVISVDDRIPVDRETLEPIWGLSYKRPWEILLIKAWAKKLKGYHKVLQSNPFDFIEGFSNPTWKYFNLTKSQDIFLKKYSDLSKSKHSKIILKTKGEGLLKDHGFLANSASFVYAGGHVEAKDEKQTYYLSIQGTSKSSWPGSLGYLDKNSVKYFHQISPEISLERGFMISGEELLNNFSSAYITSERKDNYFTGYKILDIAAHERKAQHIEFEMPADGFFDFCIKQFTDNQILSGHSKISANNANAGSRYLRNKYILVRDNQNGNESESIMASQINKSIINSNIYTSNASEYKLPRFTVYEIEYLKGYNKGDAHFLHLPRGRYILRFKSELVDKDAKYAISWISSSRFEFSETKLTSQEKVELLHNSIVSFMHKAQHYCFEKNKKTEMISYGNTFEEIGYGFVAIKSTLNCPYTILLEIDPKKIQEDGYTLKGKYKHQKEPFGIVVEPGEYDSVVFKLKKDAREYIWPPTAFKVWKKPSTIPQGIKEEFGQEEEPQQATIKASEVHQAVPIKASEVHQAVPIKASEVHQAVPIKESEVHQAVSIKTSEVRKIVPKPVDEWVEHAQHQ